MPSKYLITQMQSTNKKKIEELKTITFSNQKTTELLSIQKIDDVKSVLTFSRS